MTATSRFVTAALRYAENHERIAELSRLIKDPKRCAKYVQHPLGYPFRGEVDPCWMQKQEPQDSEDWEAPLWMKLEHLDGAALVSKFGYCAECGRTVDMLRERRALRAKKGGVTCALLRAAKAYRETAKAAGVQPA